MSAVPRGEVVNEASTWSDGVILTLSACVAGSWHTARPPLAPFLAPGAADVRVVDVGMWEQRMSYEAPGPPYAWYFTVGRMLEQQHWVLRNRWRPDSAAPTYDPLIPLQFERVYMDFLWDEVVLEPDWRNPNVAHIRVSRRIAPLVAISALSQNNAGKSDGKVWN